MAPVRGLPVWAIDSQRERPNTPAKDASGLVREDALMTDDTLCALLDACILITWAVVGIIVVAHYA
jgi:hypothetical protein